MASRIAFLIVCGMACCTSAGTAVAGPDRWPTYTNVRFGFSICYPASVFRAGPESTNSDGRPFAARDGAVFTASGINALDDDTLATQQAQERASFGAVSYSAAGRNWFVLSSTKNGRIYYTKTFLRDGQFLSLRINYPRSAAARYDPIVRKMQSCFRYGTRAF